MFHYFNEIFRLTIPMVGARIIWVAINIVGMLMVAQLGETELAASALVSALMTTIVAIAMSPLLATIIVISRYRGENNATAIRTVLHSTWLLSLGISCVVCVLLSTLPWILTKLGQPPELVPLLREYFYTLIWGTPPLYIIVSCHQFCFALQQGRLVLLWSLTAFIITTLIGFVLIYGHAGFPKLGMVGWAYALSIANWLMLPLTLLFLRYHPAFKAFNLFHWQKKIDFSQLKLLLTLGWPITLQFASELLAFAMLNIMVGWLGVGALSVQQILIQCMLLSLMIPMSVGQACSILNSQALGQKQPQTIRPITHAGIILTLLCMSVIALIYFIMPLPIIDLYIDIHAPANSALVSLAVLLFVIVAFSQIADALRNVLIGALRGLHDMQVPMWLNAVTLWLFAIPIAYLFAFHFNQGLIGLHLGFLFAFILGGGLLFWRFNFMTQPRPLR